MVGPPLKLGSTFTSGLSQSVAHHDTSNPAAFMPPKPVPHVRCLHISKLSWQLEVQSWPLWTTAAACWPEKRLPRKFHLNDTGLVYHSQCPAPHTSSPDKILDSLWGFTNHTSIFCVSFSILVLQVATEQSLKLWALNGFFNLQFQMLP